MNKNYIMPKNKTCIHKTFEHEAIKRPTAIAVKFLYRDITYRELNIRANYLANYLQTIGVECGDIVAIAMSHSVELVVSMLAVLKCGAAYLPIENTNPALRNLMYLDAANVKILISNGTCHQCYSKERTIISASDSFLFDSYLKNFNSFQSAPDDKAYIMFTSGSTGKPKGVVVPHRAVTRLVKETNYIQIRTSDSVLQFASPSFDASTFEFWGALLNGATLVPYSGTTLDPNILKRDIRNNRITILWLTAALFHLVADRFIEALKPIRILLAGGDVLNAKYINKVLDTIPDITVINGYGPTENTTFTCCHVMTVKNRPSNNVLIGKAISGTQVHILDDLLQSVERDQVGELFASGQGVALGYLNNTNKNNDFFFNNNISPGLIYRTGDLVRENMDGELEFIGRKDNQIKIRGYRVSLEEIKVNIVELKNVSDALVIRKDFESGDQLLVAYVQIKEGRELSSKEIKESLESVMPKYMIPDKFVFSAKLPITDNGKIDTNMVLSVTN